MASRFFRFGVAPVYAAAVILLVAGPTAANDAIYGSWADPETGAHVEIAPCGPGIICGDLVRLPEGSTNRDVENPSPRLRNRPLLGMRIMRNFRRTGPATWEGGGAEGRLPGRIYLPTRGSTLGDGGDRYQIRLLGPNRLEISIENCNIFTCGLERVWYRVR